MYYDNSDLLPSTEVCYRERHTPYSKSLNVKDVGTKSMVATEKGAQFCLQKNICTGGDK